MKRECFQVLVFGLLVAVIPFGCGDGRDATQVQVLRNNKQDRIPRNEAETTTDNATAVAKIQEFGGRITIDKGSTGMSMIAVDFTKTKIADDDLRNLEGLLQLRELNLSETDVTGPGLRHLKGLDHLQTLFSCWTQYHRR